MENKVYKHLKTKGKYEVLAHAKLESTLEEVVIYQSLSTKEIWVRPSNEFYDGRFEEIILKENILKEKENCQNQE